MKLIGYTCTFNEELLIPYVMPYVEACGYDKFIVYDNMSTDRTVELLSQYPFVEIRHYDTGGKFDDYARVSLHGEAIMECYSIAKIGTDEEEIVWMSWTDFDEVYFLQHTSYMSLRQFLEYDAARLGLNYYNGRLVELLPDHSILHGEFNSGMMVHEVHSMRCLKKEFELWSKPSLLLITDFIEIANIYLGNHGMELIPREGKTINHIPNSVLHTFHLRQVDYEDVIKKHAQKQYIDLTGYDCFYETNYKKYYDRLYKSAYNIKEYFKYMNLTNKA